MNDLNNNSLEDDFKLIEKVADKVHDVWAKWMKYQFSKCHRVIVNNGEPPINLFNETGDLLIPKELVDRWTRQMNTPYEELLESEKKSDRELAIEYINLLHLELNKLP